MKEPNPATGNSLFWRLWLRALTVRRPQAAVAIISLLVGAAVLSMLLGIYSGTQRAMSEEFRAYGTNVILAPAPSASDSTSSAATLAPARTERLLDQNVLDRLAAFHQRVPGLVAVPRLDVAVRLDRPTVGAPSPESVNAVAVGADYAALLGLNRGWRALASVRSLDGATCAVGRRVADRLHLKPGDTIEVAPWALTSWESSTTGRGPMSQLKVGDVLSTGGSEDDQIFLPLSTLQSLASLKDKISLVELSVPGSPHEVERVAKALSVDFGRPSGGTPAIEVRPVRQIVESEGKVLGTLRGLVISLTILILTIIALCVMATMTAIVLERRKDIAVMKALGAADRLVMRLFLAEGAGLGLVGGLAGAFVGSAAVQDLGRRLFGVNLGFTWWTLPLVSAVTMALAVSATFFPVRIVRRIQPAAVLKGE
ncbi:MAG TPA: FtsX-like permease family protein [Terriglobia bacterium]|nr:FtsX-like permease family protein [Terriglobia bacterium]